MKPNTADSVNNNLFDMLEGVARNKLRQRYCKLNLSKEYSTRLTRTTILQNLPRHVVVERGLCQKLPKVSLTTIYPPTGKHNCPDV